MQDSINMQIIVERFIKETNYKLKPIEKELEPEDIFDFKNEKIINYGSINNIIKLKEFQDWYKKEQK